MRKLVQSAVLFGILVVACKKDDETPAQNPQQQQQQGQYGYAQGQQQYPQGQQQYPQQQYPQGQQQQYPQQQYPQQQQPTTGGTPVAGGQMAVPGPLALPCSNDSGCGLARCNTQYGKCAYPCANSELDCISGATCGVGGLCMPGGAK